MVTDVDIYNKLTEMVQPGGVVVEFVGTAGTGKTSLFNELKKRGYPGLCCADYPEVWKISSYTFYIKNIILLLPTLVRLFINHSGFVKRRELAFMAILNGWDEYLDRLTDATNTTILLDQGAIFLIAYLNIWGPRGLWKPNMQGWWDKVFKKWSKTIDLIFLLDASDEILISRINSRTQDHHLKGGNKQISQNWIAKYRSLYNEILDKLASFNQNILIIRINSGEHTIEDILNKIVPELLLSTIN